MGENLTFKAQEKIQWTCVFSHSLEFVNCLIFSCDQKEKLLFNCRNSLEKMKNKLCSTKKKKRVKELREETKSETSARTGKERKTERNDERN